MSLMTKKLFSFLLICLFSFSLSDNSKVIKKLELKTKVKGKMDQNESREYFELKLPKDIPPASLLVFTVKESRKGVREGDELFSDPDIYVSKTMKYPSNREEAEWYSERYGNDILTIPSYAVDKEETFYICMYCQYKCRYELYSYLSREAPAEIGKYYSITLTKKSSISYALYVPENKDREELNVVANNPTLKNFRIYMAKDSPSSQNTFQIIPSWTNGYVISVTKYNKEYCTDCTYHILFQTEEESIDIQFTAYFQSTLTKLTAGNPINDVVKGGSRRCYVFDTSYVSNRYKSQLIISTNLFSGSVILNLGGWKKNPEDKLYNIKDQKNSYLIENDFTLMLKEEDFKAFDEAGSDPEEEGKKLHFCIYGQQISSFLINAYFLSEAQDFQRFNFISPGSEITGFLSGGQITRYRILDYNLNKNSIIRISFTKLEGDVEFYSTFCTEKCKFDAELFRQKSQDGEMKSADDVLYSKQSIMILPKNNKCYLQTSQRQINKCKILAVIRCLGNSEDVCSFKILPSIEDQAIFMSPKKTYYNIIPKGKTDLYEISVNDENVNSIVVVLNSVTGDAELQVEKIVEKNDGSSNFQGKISRNKDYIPDVVRITPAILGGKNVVGKYQVKVTASSFSSYNLYYYTTRIRTKDEQPTLNDITLSLTEGSIIKDYFPNDINYKIFSYTPSTIDKEDIKIVLTRINVHFSFKVYLDFKKIKYNYDVESNYQERLSNYIWASDHNNELTISKDDKYYSKKGPYYIVVTRDNIFEDDEKEQLDSSSLMTYYLGVTKSGLPFILNEGVEHSVTLSDKYEYQEYFYIHRDINEPFNFEINVLNGEVNVFMDVKQLTKENITKINEMIDKNVDFEHSPFSSSFYSLLSISSYDSMSLFKGYFEEHCQKKMDRPEVVDNTCSLYIYVLQSKNSKKYHKDSQYIINVQSSSDGGIVLLSGQVYNMISNKNQTDHFIIEEVKHRKGTSIFIKFKSGGGQVYVRIPQVPEVGNKIVYPDETNFDFKGADTYMGKVVTIPPKIFDRINSNTLKLQILVSVFPNDEGGETEYTITYGSEPKRISQNVPYQSFLNAGEHHYFTFYFDASTEYIYISLSNMNGDADMYLNYGNDNLPSSQKFDWSSTNLGHEYIDISIKDKFFKNNKKKNISGYYTLLVIGFTETTYTLYISTHPDKIFPLMDNSPINCQCQVKGDKCYFRYNNVFIDNFSDKDKNINKNEIIFTTQYIYGNGKMYASIYKDQELTNDPNKKYQEFFPNENKFQFSNSVSGKRNYLKVVAENQNYSKDSLILLTYICGEKTDVEITAASLQYSPLYAYIDPNRENMYYIKYNESLSTQNQEESTLNYFSSNDEALIYEFHAYIGEARVRVFTNETIYDENNTIIGYDYNHISDFTIRAESDYNDQYSYSKAYTEDYFNSIQNYLIYNKNVYFTIKPLTDFGFYVQVIYDRTWINVPIGDTKSYLINQNTMSGYFDINDEYSNVEMSLSLEEFTRKKATIYIKVLVLSKDAKQISSQNSEDKLYHYEIPSKSNHDYKGRTDDIIGVININMNNLPIIKDNEKDYKFIRALFSIEIKRYRNRRRPRDYSSALSSQGNSEDIVSPQSRVTITVTPGVNNFKRIDLPQNTYYFSNTSLLPISQNYGYNSQIYKVYDGNKEVKIFSLDKRSNQDRKMIIQLHTCEGKMSYKLSKKIIDYDNNPNDVPMKSSTDEYGRSKFLVDNLKDKHLYLSIKSSQNPTDCSSGKEKDSNGTVCSKELSYLIYYYSLTDHEYTTKKQDLKLKYRYVKDKHWQVKIIVSPLTGSDRFNNMRRQDDIEYNLFWTRNSTLKQRLDNICYLSQVLNRNEGSTNFNDTKNGVINVIRNIQLDDQNEYLIENLESQEIIYLNILARNIKTNELVAYIPLAGITNKPASRLKKIFVTFIVICLLGIVAYVTFNYFKTKLSDYEDLRNPRSTIEMSSIHSQKGGYQRISL